MEKHLAKENDKQADAYWVLSGSVATLRRHSFRNIPVILKDLDGKLPPFKIACQGPCELSLRQNNLTSLHNIHEVLVDYTNNGTLWLHDNPITSHVLGLMLIPGLSGISPWRVDGTSNKVLVPIINKHLRDRSTVIDLQHELIEHGFDEYAQL